MADQTVFLQQNGRTIDTVELEYFDSLRIYIEVLFLLGDRFEICPLFYATYFLGLLPFIISVFYPL